MPNLSAIPRQSLTLTMSLVLPPEPIPVHGAQVTPMMSSLQSLIFRKNTAIHLQWDRQRTMYCKSQTLEKQPPTARSRSPIPCLTGCLMFPVPAPVGHVVRVGRQSHVPLQMSLLQMRAGNSSPYGSVLNKMPTPK